MRLSLGNDWLALSDLLLDRLAGKIPDRASVETWHQLAASTALPLGSTYSCHRVRASCH